MSGPVPYLGSRISLISKAAIRYEGVLYSIDTEESTVSLAKVKSYGTEDRQCDRPIPPRDEVYEYIIFRGSDISDLHVCEPPRQNSALVQEDPAIVKVDCKPASPSHQPPINNEVFASSGPPPPPPPPPPGVAVPDFANPPPPLYGPAGVRQFQHPPPSLIPDRQQQQQQQHQSTTRDSRQQQQQQQQNFGSDPRRLTQQPPTGYKQQQQQQQQQLLHQRQQLQQQRQYQHQDYQGSGVRVSVGYRLGAADSAAAGKSKFDRDYDFESANKDLADELKKIQVGDVEKEAPTSADSTPAASGDADPELNGYDKKKSFFDNISCEAIDRACGRQTRPGGWREERKINSETFGIVGGARGFGRGRGFSRGRAWGYARQGYGNRGGYNW